MSDPGNGAPSASVYPIRNRMSDEQFAQERARLTELYGDNSTEAAAKRDQALAKLFYQSGWTQQELADKEGKSRQQIQRQLRFGQFLAIAPMGANTDSLPKNLSERKFREYWERTDKAEPDKVRFAMVAKLIKSETSVMTARRPSIGKEIVERFGDAKWHKLSTIVDALEADEQNVKDTLDRSTWKTTTYNGCRVERKEVGTHLEYRIFKLDKTISSSELMEKLTPIISSLEHEGHSSLAAASPPRVLVLAHQLRKLLKGWTE